MIRILHLSAKKLLYLDKILPCHAPLPILAVSLFFHMALLSAQTPPSIVAYNNKKNCLGREQ